MERLKNYLIVTQVIASLSLGCTLSRKLEINTVVDTKYRENLKTFTGRMDTAEFTAVKKAIEKELSIKLPANKAILINYVQKAPNCLTMGLGKRSYQTVIDNRTRISTEICSSVNAIDLFVFSGDTFYKEIYQAKPNYSLDSGFFYNYVFTRHDICEAFLVVKPNGDFMKHYGEDYFHQVRQFLQEK